ncbi:MAG: ATP-binding protein, partial [Xanthobacteraceae bacterium]
MKTPSTHPLLTMPLAVPAYWTPEQALAVVELLDDLRELIWDHYGPQLLDEIGYLTLKPEQANAFFRLMDERYNRVSTIITTNLDLPEWYELFQKKPLVDALLDRLQHHCITIRIDGPS